MTELSRRGFLRGALAGGGALSLAVTFGCGSTQAARIARVDQTGELVANLYVTVLPSGRIALTVNKAEIGQGVSTGYATLAAEELDVPIEHVDVHYADSRPELRTSFNMQVTGGSTSTKEAFGSLRSAAASAREMLVTAAAARWGVPAGECTAASGRVLHAASQREAGYGELTRLAARVEVPSSPRLKSAKEFTLIGKFDRRVDARAKIDGTAKFGIDVAVPGMVNAYVIHGPVFGARPRTISADAARKRPGVIDIFGFRWGVAVVADRYWQALAAARAVEVSWDAGDAAGLDSEAMQQAMRTSDERGISVADRGNPGDALGKAQTRLTATYEAPYLAHAPLEPQNCTVEVKGRTAEVWAPTQSPTIVQAFVSDAIGCDIEDVVVHTTLSGGGFGRRGIADVCAQAAVIAKRVGKPVKLVWSRESDMTQGYYRPVYAMAMAGGVSDGRATALTARVLSQSIALSSGEALGAAMTALPSGVRSRIVDSLKAMFATNSVGDLFAAEGLSETPYRFANLGVTAAPVHTRVPVSTWRSVGNSVTGFAVESFVDELARAANRDPLDFRRELVAPDSRQRRVLDALAKLSGWGAAAPSGVGRGLARHFSFDTEVGEVAEVEVVNGRIRVRKVYCVVDCGLAVNPDLVRAQMEGAIIFGISAALDQEITLVDGVVQQRNYDSFPSLRMFESPDIVVQVLDSDAEPTGVGEPGLPPIAAAVANGVFAATGVRLRRMPLQRAWNERGAR